METRNKIKNLQNLQNLPKEIFASQIYLANRRNWEGYLKMLLGAIDGSGLVLGAVGIISLILAFIPIINIPLYITLILFIVPCFSGGLGGFFLDYKNVIQENEREENLVKDINNKLILIKEKQLELIKFSTSLIEYWETIKTKTEFSHEERSLLKKIIPILKNINQTLINNDDESHNELIKKVTNVHKEINAHKETNKSFLPPELEIHSNKPNSDNTKIKPSFKEIFYSGLRYLRAAAIGVGAMVGIGGAIITLISNPPGWAILLFASILFVSIFSVLGVALLCNYFTTVQNNNITKLTNTKNKLDKIISQQETVKNSAKEVSIEANKTLANPPNAEEIKDREKSEAKQQSQLALKIINTQKVLSKIREFDHTKLKDHNRRHAPSSLFFNSQLPDNIEIASPSPQTSNSKN